MAISQYSTPVQNTLEQYIPLPLEMMTRAGAINQQRYDQSMDLDSSTQTGLASIEAKAPGYQQYVQQATSNYRNDSQALLQKYNNDASDPQFQRDQRQLINKYKNDPNWGIIKNSNEQINLDQQLSAKERAEGKLVINPSQNFNGVDATTGKLIPYQSSMKTVNTLDDWENQLKTAHSSLQFNGKGYNTNVPSLNQAKNAILSDITNNTPQVQDMITAYKQQGLSDQDARRAVIQNANSLVGKYGNIVQRDEGYFSNQVALKGQAQMAEFHKEELDNKLKVAKMRAEATILSHQNGGSGSQEVVNTPIAVPTNNAPIDLGGGLKAFQSDQSTKAIDKDIKLSQNISGKYFQIDPTKGDKDDLNLKTNGGFKINNGKEVGVKNIWVTDYGNLAAGGKDYNITQKPDPKTREISYYLGNQKVHKQTVVEYNDSSPLGTKTAPGSKVDNPKTYYKLANRDEAIEYMGADDAYYEGKDKDNQLAHLPVSLISKDVSGQGNDLLKVNKPINIPKNKIEEAVNYESEKYGWSNQEKANKIKEVQDNLIAATTHGIRANDLNALKILAGDQYHDRIYHDKVIKLRYKETKTPVDPALKQMLIQQELDKIGE